MKIKLDIEIRPFTVPNFVVPVQPAGERQDGFKEAPSIPLSDLDAETLDKLCSNFRADVFKKAGKQ